MAAYYESSHQQFVGIFCYNLNYRHILLCPPNSTRRPKGIYRKSWNSSLCSIL